MQALLECQRKLNIGKHECRSAYIVSSRMPLIRKTPWLEQISLVFKLRRLFKKVTCDFFDLRSRSRCKGLFLPWNVKYIILLETDTIDQVDGHNTWIPAGHGYQKMFISQHYTYRPVTWHDIEEVTNENWWFSGLEGPDIDMLTLKVIAQSGHYGRTYGC